jgi:hypothetical protein
VSCRRFDAAYQNVEEAMEKLKNREKTMKR